MKDIYSRIRLPGITTAKMNSATWLGDQATALGMDADQFSTDRNAENLLKRSLQPLAG
jgi:hypothetical protein